MSVKQDRNFDDLYERFETKIYDTVKGEWRLKLLKQDLERFTEIEQMNIWDAGCGQGQISLWLAQFGHQLSLCDISTKMLTTTKQAFQQAGYQATFYQQSAQDLAATLPEFDLVICHAVLEWLADPIKTLNIIASRVKQDGFLSLLFYNRNAMVYSNILKGGWHLPPILNDTYIGVGRKLTPPNPQFPHDIIAAVHEAGFNIEQHTGIRVFHDYMSQHARDDSDTETLFELEEQYCRQPTYRDMGRYVHLLLKRQNR